MNATISPCDAFTSDETIRYHADGYLTLRGVFSAEEMAEFQEEAGRLARPYPNQDSFKNQSLAVGLGFGRVGFPISFFDHSFEGFDGGGGYSRDFVNDEAQCVGVSKQVLGTGRITKR
jgi:hypothetical protein